MADRRRVDDRPGPDGWATTHSRPASMSAASRWTTINFTDQEGHIQVQGDLPFDPVDAKTYPTRYTRTDGGPRTPRSATRSLRCSSRTNGSRCGGLTLNLGVRWDYEAGHWITRRHRQPGTTNRCGVRPVAAQEGRRSAAAMASTNDQVFLAIARTALQAQTGSGNRHCEPRISRSVRDQSSREDQHGDPRSHDHAACRQNRDAEHESRSRGDSARAPLARCRWQLTACGLAAASARHPRPELSESRSGIAEAAGSAVCAGQLSGGVWPFWYRALLIGVQQRHTRRYSLSAAYTLSSTERDTEDFNFVPQDQRTTPPIAVRA